MILLSIAVFALAMRWLGLIPAVFASVMLSAAASDKFQLVPALVISRSFGTWLCARAHGSA